MPESNLLTDLIAPLRKKSATDSDIDAAISSGAISPSTGEALRGLAPERIHEYLTRISPAIKSTPPPVGRQSMADALMAARGGGTADTSFMPPTGQKPSVADLGGAVLPSGAASARPASRATPRAGGGTDDTRFMGPQGQQAPAIDLGGAVLPVGAPPTALSLQPQSPNTTDDERRLRLLRAARTFREGASEFRNITSPGEVRLGRGLPADRSVRAEDLRADEDRLRGRIEEKRQGDFSNADSAASKFMRDVLRKSGFPNVPDTMTASQAAGVSPVLKTYLDNYVRMQAVDQRRDAAEAKVKIEQGDLDAVKQGDLSRLPTDAREALQKSKDSFYTNSRINGLKGQVDAARSIKSRIDASESFGPTSAFRSLARAAGETGVMTDRDIADFSERMGIKGLYDKAYKFFGSSLPPELRQEIFNVAKAFSKDARESLDQEIDSRVRDLTGLYSYLPKDTIRKFFTGEDSEATTETATGDTATVRGSDGSTYTVKAGAKKGDTFKIPSGESVSVAEVLN